MARDFFHNLVKQALQQEGWQIVKDPLRLEWEEVKLEIDLAAERVVAADRGNEKIAVEIKSFLEQSTVYPGYLTREEGSGSKSSENVITTRHSVAGKNDPDPNRV